MKSRECLTITCNTCHTMRVLARRRFPVAVDETIFASSNLDSGQYDEETRVMRITMQSGRSWLWDRVDPVMWDRLKSAVSPGQFLRYYFPPGIED